MTKTLAVAVGVAAAMLAAGCSVRECSRELPSCALAIELENEAWEPGLYTFRVSAGGEETTCTAALPLDRRLAQQFECDSDVASLAPYPGMDRVVAQEEWPRHFYVFGSPAESLVRVEREGVEIASGAFLPRYEVTEPNGEGCGACENAVVALAF